MPKAPTVRKTKLTELRLHEVSLVRAPANQHAVIHIRKESPMPLTDKIKAAIQKLRAPVEQYDAGKSAETKEAVQKAIDELTEVVKESLTEDGTVADVKKALTDCSDDDLAAEMAARKARTAATKKSADADTEVTKSASERFIEKQSALLEQQTAVIKGLADQMAEIKKDRDHAVLVNKAKDMLGDSGAFTPDELADVIGKLDAKQVEKMEEVLKGATAIRRDYGLSLVVGKDDATAPDATTAINKAAAELQKSDPKLSDDAAIYKALEGNPDLYDAWEREHPAIRA